VTTTYYEWRVTGCWKGPQKITCRFKSETEARRWMTRPHLVWTEGPALHYRIATFGEWQEVKPVTETEFLVDGHKHRIVKRDEVWKLYCPERGGDSIISAVAFESLRIALVHYPCPHDGIFSPFQINNDSM
jgi:hypothetical protein